MEEVAVIRETGTKLAERAAEIGARGFMGFDTVVTADGQIIYTECNYRGTGSTNPEITAQKATNFVDEKLKWLFVPFIPFNKNVSPDLPAVLDVLRKNSLLFEGAHSSRADLDTPQAVILYGMLPGGELGNYCLSFFWKTGQTQEIFATINKVLKNLGAGISIPCPLP